MNDGVRSRLQAFHDDGPNMLSLGTGPQPDSANRLRHAYLNWCDEVERAIRETGHVEAIVGLQTPRHLLIAANSLPIDQIYRTVEQELQLKRLVIKNTIDLVPTDTLHELSIEADSTAEAPNSPTIFLSYRRSDSPDLTHRLDDRLVALVGRDHIFLDVDRLQGGENVQSSIAQHLAASAILLVIIGPQWEVNRLSNSDDWVRFEIEQALEMGKQIVPILTHNATMPERAEIPEPLGSFANMNALRLRPNPDFEFDVERIIRHLGLTAAPSQDRTGTHHDLSLDSDLSAIVTEAVRELTSGLPPTRLHQAVGAAVDRAHDCRARLTMDGDAANVQAEHASRLEELQQAVLPAAALIGTLARWGGAEHDEWWFGSIERLTLMSSIGGASALVDLRLLPAMVCLFSAGVGAVGAGRLDLLRRLLNLSVHSPFHDEPVRATERLRPQNVLNLPCSSRHVFELLYPIHSVHLGRGSRFTDDWEVWQYHISLQSHGWLDADPFVRVSRTSSDSYAPTPGRRLRAELAEDLTGHPWVRAGLFDSRATLMESAAAVELAFSVWGNNQWRAALFGQSGMPIPAFGTDFYLGACGPDQQR